MLILVYTTELARVVIVYPPFLCPDQRDPDHFCRSRQRPRFLAVTHRTHTLWHQLEETDHLKQTQETRAVPSGDRGRAEPLALCDHVFICKNSPHEEKIRTYHCLQEVCCFWTIRLCNLLRRCVEIASCLNWIDECIVTAVVFVCLFFFFPFFFLFLFITLWSYTVVYLKGK